MHLHEWLKKKQVPDSVIAVLSREDFPYYREIGSVNFDSKTGIMEMNTEEDWLPKFIKSKLLTIGSAINGDFWVLDWRSNTVTVSVTPHDDTENLEEAIVDSLIAPIAQSFDEFMKMAKADTLPIDYYDARDREK